MLKCKEQDSSLKIHFSHNHPNDSSVHHNEILMLYLLLCDFYVAVSLNFEEFIEKKCTSLNKSIFQHAPLFKNKTKQNLNTSQIV